MAPGLGRNAAWMAFGQGGYALGQWAILVILARTGGPALVGAFTLALAITAPIIVFSQLQLRQIQVVDAAGRYAFADFRAVRLATTALALLLIAAIAALGGYPASLAAVILAVGLTRAIESLSDVDHGLAQRHERLDLVAQSLLLRGTTGVAALGAALALTGSLLAGLLAQAAVWAAIWWLFDRRVTRPWRRDPPAGPALGRRLRLAWLGLPLGVTLLLDVLNTNVPRYVIEGFLGLEALGIFAALAYFVLAGGLVINAACQAASPRLARLFAAGELGAFRRLLLRLCGTGALLGLAGVLGALAFAAPLLRLLYGEAFAAQAWLLAPVMAAGALHYALMPLGHGLSAMHRFRVQPLIQGSAVALNALACLLLVPRYGLAGAIGGWSLALAGQGLLGLVLTARYLRRAAREVEDPTARLHASATGRPPR